MDNQITAPFEIGLVMAGAVSAGAYTAGVMDYLIEALEAWQQAKDEGDKLVAQHSVKIKVMTGASAGGMTAAITAVELLRRANNPKATKQSDYKSLMYQAWVERIDISHLLKTTDLNSSDNIKSLFDSNAIDEIANNIIDVDRMPPWKEIPYIDSNLKLYLTLSNLRGLPYEFKLTGQTGFPFGMTDHADYQYVEIQKGTSKEEWTKLRNAAIATGAFPVGLASRLIKRDTNEYKERVFKDGRDISGLMKLDQSENDPYSFVAVDGGTLNNEPIELARSVWERYTEDDKKKITSYRSLVQVRAEVRARTNLKQEYALIIIDPFASPVDMGSNATEKDTELLNIIAPIIGTLRAQSLFKIEELLRAGDPEWNDRFLVAPIRYENTNAKAVHAIACGFFGGFGGFLAEEFRKHDYYLGRRNCQRFLDGYFVLSKQEAINKGWDVNDLYLNDNGYPLIPIMKGSKLEQPQGVNNPWPAYKKENAVKLKEGLTVRVKTLMQRALPFGWIDQSWVMIIMILSGLFIVVGEFVKAAWLSCQCFYFLEGLKNSYIMLFQILLLLFLAVLLVLRLGKRAIERKIIESAYKIFINQVKSWGIKIE